MLSWSYSGVGFGDQRDFQPHDLFLSKYQTLQVVLRHFQSRSSCEVSRLIKKFTLITCIITITFYGQLRGGHGPPEDVGGHALDDARVAEPLKGIDHS